MTSWDDETYHNVQESTKEQGGLQGLHRSSAKRLGNSSASLSKEDEPVCASPVTIRRMEVRDAGEVAALAGELGYPMTPELMEARLINMQTSSPQQPAELLVAVAATGEHVIGWVHVCVPLFLTGTRSASVWGLVVGAAHRGQGLGRRLMDAAEEWAIEHGCEEMRLTSAAHRIDAHAFYERLGYNVEKSQLVLARSLESRRTVE